MTSNSEQLKDKLVHARANYWILTCICGVFLALCINKIKNLDLDSITMLYIILFLISGYFTIKLSKYICMLKMLKCNQE